MAVAQTIDFSRPWWLPNTHLETVWARKIGDVPEYHRELADTPDKDMVAIDYLMGAKDQPGIVIFHGMEGCSRSHTVRQVAGHFQRKEWSVIVPHFRTCGIMNRLPRAYHAGDSADVGWMLSYAQAALPHISHLHAVGISLGGNALAKWLGENPGQEIIASAATVCAPFDLAQCSARLERFFNRNTYGRYFLGSLKEKIAQKLVKYPFLATREKLEKIRSIRSFDDMFTAPLHGFDGVDDYYRRASAYPKLAAISEPLLCLQSDNDALVPVHELPDNPNLHECRTRGGGHSGFVSAPFPGTVHWLASRLERFFDERT